ncbi:MAG: amidohydrolase [Planctomycetes bacterium]|nr:amidohydrolase [Planctomycetota bacterium]
MLIAFLSLAGACASRPANTPTPSAPALPTHADLLLTNGRIITLDEARPEARALAIGGGVVIAVGNEAELAHFADEHTQVIDLHGALAVPGLIDSHAHLWGIGAMQRELDLRDTKSWEEIVERVAHAANSRPNGEWILGRGWHQEKWDHVPDDALEGWPVKAALDRVAPHNPVVLRHASGHAAIANSKALELAGAASLSTDPPGGRILRDAHGEPTGVLNEAAQALVDGEHEADPARRRALLREEALLAAQECLSKGLTSLVDAGSTLEQVSVLRELAQTGELPLRLWVMLGEPDEVLRGKLEAQRTIGAGGGFLTVRAIKRYMDGALGSRGAWMLAPYSDAPTTSGLPSTSPEALRQSAELARRAGFQLCVHAIGDRANREVLDTYERVLGPRAKEKDLRWRVEHAQHIDSMDIPRFGQLGVIASMQGIHCVSDGPWVPQRIGAERARSGAYVWRSLLDTGAVVCNGTDAPVEDVDPLPCFRASVTRKLPDGTSFYPEQRMSRLEALKSYTLWAAYAAFEEDVKGSLAPGKYGDVTVIDRDVLRIPEVELAGARVLMTIVGGKVAWKREGH